MDAKIFNSFVVGCRRRSRLVRLGSAGPAGECGCLIAEAFSSLFFDFSVPKRVGRAELLKCCSHRCFACIVEVGQHFHRYSSFCNVHLLSGISPSIHFSLFSVPPPGASLGRRTSHQVKRHFLFVCISSISCGK